MASAFGPRLWKRLPPSVPAARSLGRRMTLHAAAALLVFAALQIWLVSSAIAAGAPSAFIIVALVMLVALALPAARLTEPSPKSEAATLSSVAATSCSAFSKSASSRMKRRMIAASAATAGRMR